MNAAPGLISSSCWPAGSAIGSLRHGRGRDRVAVEQRADGGVDRGLDELAGDADDRAAAARQRDGARAVARRRRRRAIGTPLRVECRDLGQARRLELVETQCGAVDHVVPVEQRHRDRVGDTRLEARRSACRRRSRRRTCGPSPRSIGDQRRMRGQRRRTRRQPQRGHLGGGGQFQRQVGRRAVLHDALRCGPRGARVTVGGGVGRAEDVDRVGIAVGPRGAGLADQVGEVRALARRAPTPSASPTSARARSACGSGSPAPRATAPSSPRTARRRARRRTRSGRATRIPDPIGRQRNPAAVRAPSTVCRRLDRMREAGGVVLGDGEVGDAELHARRAVVGADRGDPHPRRLAVRAVPTVIGLPGSSKRSVLVPLTVETSMRRTCAPTAVALGVMVMRGVGDRMVEVDLQPLADGGLQRVGHPAGRRVAVDRGGRTGRGRDVGQRGGVRRRTRHRDPAAGPVAVHRVGVAGGIVGHPVERVPGVARRRGSPTSGRRRGRSRSRAPAGCR